MQTFRLALLFRSFNMCGSYGVLVTIGMCDSLYSPIGSHYCNATCSLSTRTRKDDAIYSYGSLTRLRHLHVFRLALRSQHLLRFQLALTVSAHTEISTRSPTTLLTYFS